MDIVIATKNSGKVQEFQNSFNKLPINVVALASLGTYEDAVENGLTFKDNALLKARHYASLTGKACLADDSGLEVDALNGAPGIYSARYAGEHASDEENIRKLLSELADLPLDKRTARFHCVLSFVDHQGSALFTEGVCEGIILTEPRGTGGFGYDPVFYLPELGKTMAELTKDEKNKISHRGQAIKEMSTMLTGHLKCE